MRLFYIFTVFLLIIGCCIPNKTVPIYHLTNGKIAEKAGVMLLTDTDKGLLVRVSVENLPPGPHGFHIHENPSCAALTTAQGTFQTAGHAGNHYDPQKTGTHQGPGGSGHLGDLPVLWADLNGFATATFTLSGLTVADFINRSVIIHEFGDNYRDLPLPSGGGGARIACGIIE